MCDFEWSEDEKTTEPLWPIPYRPHRSMNSMLLFGPETTPS